jgi:hypothetical protein
MGAPAVAPPRPLVDGVDVDAVARTTRGCPGVEDLHGGFPEVATYLPGRRVLGVRVGDRAVEVQVRAAWGIPIPQIGAGIQAAVVPLAGGRAVDVMIADLGDPPGTDQTSTAGQPGAGSHTGAAALDTAVGPAQAAGRMKVGGQAVVRHTGPAPVGRVQGDPLAVDALRERPDHTADRPEWVDRARQADQPASLGQPAKAESPVRKGSDRS